MNNNILLRLYHHTSGKVRRRILNKIIKSEGGQMYSHTLRRIYKEKYNITIGYGTYGGCFNTQNNLPGNISFGNYCSIAQNVRIFRANHPKDVFTTHPLLYNPIAGYVLKDELERPFLEIGHDVWIGEWAVILPGVKKIGNGAIIGAGSIVTKDVEPYSIVVGNPAKRISYRFNEGTIEKLEHSRWWELDKNELIKNIENFVNLI